MLGLFRSKRQTGKRREPLAAGVANRSGRTIRLLRSALNVQGRYDAAVTTDGSRGDVVTLERVNLQDIYIKGSPTDVLYVIGATAT